MTARDDKGSKSSPKAIAPSLGPADLSAPAVGPPPADDEMLLLNRSLPSHAPLLSVGADLPHYGLPQLKVSLGGEPHVLSISIGSFSERMVVSGGYVAPLSRCIEHIADAVQTPCELDSNLPRRLARALNRLEEAVCHILEEAVPITVSMLGRGVPPSEVLPVLKKLQVPLPIPLGSMADRLSFWTSTEFQNARTALQEIGVSTLAVDRSNRRTLAVHSQALLAALGDGVTKPVLRTFEDLGPNLRNAVIKGRTSDSACWKQLECVKKLSESKTYESTPSLRAVGKDESFRHEIQEILREKIIPRDSAVAYWKKVGFPNALPLYQKTFDLLYSGEPRTALAEKLGVPRSEAAFAFAVVGSSYVEAARQRTSHLSLALEKSGCFSEQSIRVVRWALSGMPYSAIAARERAFQDALNSDHANNSAISGDQIRSILKSIARACPELAPLIKMDQRTSTRRLNSRPWKRERDVSATLGALSQGPLHAWRKKLTLALLGTERRPHQSLGAIAAIVRSLNISPTFLNLPAKWQRSLVRFIGIEIKAGRIEHMTDLHPLLEELDRRATAHKKGSTNISDIRLKLNREALLRPATVVEEFDHRGSVKRLISERFSKPAKSLLRRFAKSDTCRLAVTVPLDEAKIGAAFLAFQQEELQRREQRRAWAQIVADETTSDRRTKRLIVQFSCSRHKLDSLDKVREWFKDVERELERFRIILNELGISTIYHQQILRSTNNWWTASGDLHCSDEKITSYCRRHAERFRSRELQLIQQGYPSLLARELAKRTTRLSNSSARIEGDVRENLERREHIVLRICGASPGAATTLCETRADTWMHSLRSSSPPMAREQLALFLPLAEHVGVAPNTDPRELLSLIVTSAPSVTTDGNLLRLGAYVYIALRSHLGKQILTFNKRK